MARCFQCTRQLKKESQGQKQVFSHSINVVLVNGVMKSTKVLNPRLITPKTMHEHMIMQHATVDTVKSIKTGTSLPRITASLSCGKSIVVHCMHECNNPESSITG